ncbi:hypothetical protein LTR16_002457 [Cryomyces antarcticus]|uniref:HTH CENPB-type domain-containing protein n=1 Tax=Cryomyces antarcticus TaxID=329879 RepID=A0ABR0KT84_9PEZI|nr:hypothetical protein LTR16_002457 [Cryomyces antarcticus]
MPGPTRHSAEVRAQVQSLIEAGHDNAYIEAACPAVSERTLRRWRLNIQRFNKTGGDAKPTGRPRLLDPKVEDALFEWLAENPAAKYDEMQWYVYDRFRIETTSRTLRRAFDRRNTSKKALQYFAARRDGRAGYAHPDPTRTYTSPYAPTPGSAMGDMSHAQEAAQAALAMGQDPAAHPSQLPAPSAIMQPSAMMQPSFPIQMDADDEETLQLQLQQIALQKAEVELKLKMRNIQREKRASSGALASPSVPSSAPRSKRNSNARSGPASSSSQLPEEQGRQHEPESGQEQTPNINTLEHRLNEALTSAQSQSQEGTIDSPALQRPKVSLPKSMRTDLLDANWVSTHLQWPNAAAATLSKAMLDHGLFSYRKSEIPKFNAIIEALQPLIDREGRGGGVAWEDGKHDDLLSERVKMKMTAIRSHMIAAGEIVRREGGYTGWKRAGEVDDLAEDLRAAEQLKAQLGEQGFQYLQQEAQQRMVQDSQQVQHAANHGRAHQAADNTVHEHEDPTHQAQQALHHAAAHHSLQQNIHNHSSAMQEDMQQQQQQRQQQPDHGSVQYDRHYVNPYAMPQQQQQQQMQHFTSQTGLHQDGQIDPSLQTLVHATQTMS